MAYIPQQVQMINMSEIKGYCGKDSIFLGKKKLEINDKRNEIQSCGD